MVDPKGSPEIPASADPAIAPESAAPVKPTRERDPILEELLRSKSTDSEVAGKKVKARKPRRSRTGTSLDKRGKKPSLALVGAITAGVVLLGGGGTALWLTLTPQQSQIDPDRNSNKVQGLVAKDPAPENEKSAPWADDPNVYPVELDTWQTEPATFGMTDENREALFESFSGTSLGIDAGILPSEAAGNTSDDSKVRNEDGTLNPYYSYWTMESFTTETGQIVEKFLNPRFGGWESYQGRGSDPNGIDPATLFPYTFTNDLLEKGDAVSSWLPIYADWSNNSYGRSDLSATGPRWYGEITRSTSTFKWNEAIFQYDVDFEADVKFTAFKSNGEKVSEKGKLSLQLVANPGNERGAGGKVLVNGSKLTIGG